LHNTHFELHYRNSPLPPPFFAEKVTAMTGLRGLILRLRLKTGHDSFLTVFPISLFAVLGSLKPVKECWVLTAILMIALKNPLKRNLLSDIV
jgi:hypothetical protein